MGFGYYIEQSYKPYIHFQNLCKCCICLCNKNTRQTFGTSIQILNGLIATNIVSGANITNALAGTGVGIVSSSAQIATNLQGTGILSSSTQISSSISGQWTPYPPGEISYFLS